MMRRMFYGIRKGEWKVVATVSVVAATLSSVPMLTGLVIAAVGGTAWMGTTAFAPGDMAAYLASIAQAEEGAVVFVNLFTTEKVSNVT